MEKEEGKGVTLIKRINEKMWYLSLSLLRFSLAVLGDFGLIDKSPDMTRRYSARVTRTGGQERRMQIMIMIKLRTKGGKNKDVVH